MNLPLEPAQLSFAQLYQLPEYQAQKEHFFQNLRSQYRTDVAFQKAVASLKYDFAFHARAKQRVPEGDWFIWLIRSGRGFGKSFTGAHWIKHKEAEARKAKQKIEMAIVGDIYMDIVDSQVKAILDCYAPNDPNRPEFVNQKLVWKSGCLAYLVQAETPKKFRSKNLHCAWVDELAKFQYPQKAWDGLMFAVRKGDKPQVLVTTTPATRSSALLRRITLGEYGPAAVVRGNSYENRDNLSSRYLDTIIKPYVGTRLGQQEIEGADIEDASGALWNHDMIKYWSHFVEEYEASAKIKGFNLPEDWQDNYKATKFRDVVVAIDPAATAHLKSDETGLIVCARDHDNRGFVLEDRSGKYSPNQWANIAVELYRKYKAKAIVAERNNGGDMVGTTIHNTDPRVRVETIHASKGKLVRAEPIARLYEQGRVYHLRGSFTELEDQLCNYTGKPADKPDLEVEEFNRVDSPDRMDALVWCFSYLFSDQIKTPGRGFTTFPVSAY